MILTSGPLELPAQLASLLVGSATAALLIRHRHTIRGTTLVAPWAWTLVALVSVVGTEFLISLVAFEHASWNPAMRYCAAVGIVCPTVSLLGAKRPQHAAWQFVVATLWIVLVFPVLGWAVRGGRFELDAARSWLLLVLILVGVANYVPTCHAAAAVAAGAGQVALLGEHLPVTRWPVDTPGSLPGLTLMLAAAVMVAMGWPRCKRPEPGLERVWFDFRDAFGVMWALRVALRINVAAQRHGWHVSLAWKGFRVAEGGLDDKLIIETTQPAMCALLRRFVSSDWIDSRLKPSAHREDSRKPSRTE